MIHIATVHWKSDRWIDVQFRFLKKNLKRPFLAYAHLDGVSEEHYGKFALHFSGFQGFHADKLNHLASTICERAHVQDDDLLIFIDGDAFPIAPFVERLEPVLAQKKLIAIQTLENNGDIQPHPSFCMTTVGFWKRIGGDWGIGGTWKNRSGQEITDVGGNLLKALEKSGVPWHPLTRTNRFELHPLWFGIYDDFVYHHGAGFRRPISRIDAALLLSQDERLLRENQLWILERCQRTPEPNMEESPLGQAMLPVVERAQRLGETVYELILKDEDFFEIFRGRRKWPDS